MLKKIENNIHSFFYNIVIPFSIKAFIYMSFTAICILFIILFSAQNVKANLNDSSLVGYWSFDTNEDEDRSLTSCTQVTHPIHLTEGCILNSCYHFEGDTDRITCLDYAGLTFSTSDFTWNFWINLNDTSPQTDRECLVCEQTITNNDNTFIVARQVSTSVGAWETSAFTTSNFFETAEENRLKWIMITVMRKGNFIYFYKNTTQIGSAWAFNYNLDLLNLEFAGLGASSYLNGSLDEIALYNRNLTDNELNYLYNNHLGCNPVTTNCENISNITSNTPQIFFNTTILNHSYITYVDWVNSIYYWNFTDIYLLNNTNYNEVIVYIDDITTNHFDFHLINESDYNFSFYNYAKNVSIMIDIRNENTSSNKTYYVQLVGNSSILELAGDIQMLTIFIALAIIYGIGLLTKRYDLLFFLSLGCFVFSIILTEWEFFTNFNTTIYYIVGFLLITLYSAGLYLDMRKAEDNNKKENRNRKWY